MKLIKTVLRDAAGRIVGTEERNVPEAHDVARAAADVMLSQAAALGAVNGQPVTFVLGRSTSLPAGVDWPEVVQGTAAVLRTPQYQARLGALGVGAVRVELEPPPAEPPAERPAVGFRPA